MRRQPYWRYLPVLLLVALAWSPALPVTAQGEQPPSATIHTAQPASSLALPAAQQAVLYDQSDLANGHGIVSQVSSENRTSQAADDFFVTLGSNSWQITAVEVAGQFSPPGAVSSVNVQFYADAGGRPGYLLTMRSVHPISGTATTGNFFLPLAPAAVLASNANYWVSVQAVPTSNVFWYWNERGTQHQAAAVWENPNNGFSTGCVDWTPLNPCFPGEGPDLLFRLYGTTSTDHVHASLTFLPLVRR